MFQIRFGKKNPPHFPALLLAQIMGLREKVDMWFFSAEHRPGEVVTEQKKSQSVPVT